MRRIPPIVVANLALPTLLLTTPVKLVHESHPLHPPLIEFTFEVLRLFCQRVRFIADNAKPAIRRNIDRLLAYRDIIDAPSGKPVLGAKIMILVSRLSNGT